MQLNLIQLWTLNHQPTTTEVTGMVVVHTAAGDTKLPFAATVHYSPFKDTALPTYPIAVRLAGGTTTAHLAKFEFEPAKGSGPALTGEQQVVLRESAFDHILDADEQLRTVLIKRL